MTADHVLDTARAEIGTTEYPAGSNRTKYGRAYGMDGVPWCMIFVWWCFNAAGAGELFYDGGKTASCNQYVTWAKRAGQWITEDFRAGDIIFLDFDKYPDADHVGIVESTTLEYVVTIEGNTSANGSQDNGGAVMRKVRRYSDVYGAARPIYTQNVKTPEIVTPQGEEKMTLDEFKKLMKQYREELRDNDCGSWSQEARDWVTTNGIFNGSGNSPDGTPNYMWEDLTTREQLAQVIYNLAKKFGML